MAEMKWKVSKSAFILGAIFLYLLTFANILYPKIINEFSTFSSSDYKITPNLSLSLSSSIFHNSSGALKISRNIAYDPSTKWSETSEIIYTLPSAEDFGEYQYFVFWYYDDAVLSGNNSTVIQVGLYDGDEWWLSTQKLTAITWGQMVIPIKDAGTTNDEYIEGFTVPNWEKNATGYAGNGIFNKENIQKIKFSFGAAHSITGNFYIDDIQIINLINKSFPINNGYIDPAISGIKIYFGEKMYENSFTSQTVKLIDSINDTTLSTLVTYNTELNILTITNFNLQENRFYKVILTNVYFYGLTSKASYTLNFSTQYPKTVYPDNSYTIQDLQSGTYISIPENGVYSPVTFSLDTITEVNAPFTVLKSVIVKPEGINFKNPCKIIFFTDDITGYDSLKIYQYAENTWKEVPSYWRRSENYIEGVINYSGKIVLSAGTEADNYSDFILQAKPSSNPFSPNNDGKNDKTYFYIDVRTGGYLTIKIYNLNGDLIKTVTESTPVSSGSYYTSYYWDGKDFTGKTVNDGIYIYTIELKKLSSASDIPRITKIKGVISVIK